LVGGGLLPGMRAIASGEFGPSEVEALDREFQRGRRRVEETVALVVQSNMADVLQHFRPRARSGGNPSDGLLRLERSQASVTARPGARPRGLALCGCGAESIGLRTCAVDQRILSPNGIDVSHGAVPLPAGLDLTSEFDRSCEPGYGAATAANGSAHIELRVHDRKSCARLFESRGKSLLARGKVAIRQSSVAASWATVAFSSPIQGPVERKPNTAKKSANPAVTRRSYMARPGIEPATPRFSVVRSSASNGAKILQTGGFCGGPQSL
jgi:hypothetical protein